MRMNVFVAVGLLICGALFGSLLTSHQRASAFVTVAAQVPAEKAPVTLDTLQADLVALKSIAPTQSHVMVDVAIQFGNLWFAAQRKNWPLATYYLNEGRNRINWAVRINPTVKAQITGEPIDMKGIFDGIDTGSITPLKATIDKKDSVAFVAAYKVMLESCYACHKSVGRPYLRPQIPLVTTQPIINVSPAATWPQ
jgi:hypothetical protein